MALDEFRGRDFTGKEINEIKEAFGGFVLEQIVKHAGSPVGNYLYEAYQNKLSEINRPRRGKRSASVRKNIPEHMQAGVLPSSLPVRYFSVTPEGSVRRFPVFGISGMNVR